ncbi:MAG: NosD domain-containing protein [Candidatus Altarchaeaceae archaeon]
MDGDDSGIGYGIYLNNKQNNTIRNCIITDFDYGIYLYSSSNNTIEGNEISNNKIGIFSNSSNSKINSNFVCGNINYDFYSDGNNVFDIFDEGENKNFVTIFTISSLNFIQN